MGRPWSAVLELGLGHADPVPSLGASPKGKMVRWIPEGVYSVGLLGAKTEIPGRRVLSLSSPNDYVWKSDFSGHGAIGGALYHRCVRALSKSISFL